jgi:hypothetical protein
MSEANNSFAQILFGDGTNNRPASKWPRAAIAKLDNPAEQCTDLEETTDQHAALTSQIDACHQQAGTVVGFDELLRRSNAQRLANQLNELHNDSPA